MADPCLFEKNRYGFSPVEKLKVLTSGALNNFVISILFSEKRCGNRLNHLSPPLFEFRSKGREYGFSDFFSTHSRG